MDNTYKEDAANQICRTVVAVFAIIKVLVALLFGGPASFLPRVLVSLLETSAVFSISGSANMSNRSKAVFVPYSVVFAEATHAMMFGGDRFIYVVFIGSVLLSLLYEDTRSLIYLATLNLLFIIYLMVFSEARLFGPLYPLQDEIINAIQTAVIYAVIIIVSRHNMNYIKSFRYRGKTFEAILKAMPSFVFVVNDFAKVEFISDSLAKHLKIEDPQDAIGKPFRDIFSAEESSRRFENFIRRRGTINETYVLPADDGDNWYLVHSIPLSNKLARFFEIIEITPIIESRQAAEEANRTKTNFLATISHEIRTPMNAIIGIAQIQMQNAELPNEYKRAIEMIYSSGRNLLGIINDVLDMSKIETGKLELIRTEYDLPSFINDTVQLNIIRIGSKRINFELHASENLPSRLVGDELRLKQALNNLLSNAIKYTESGYVRLKVNHSIFKDEIVLTFTVEDTGQGMTQENLDRLFTAYSRFNEKINRTVEGTGLGLSITRKLVEMMDGAISVKSEYGKGSTFSISVRQGMVNCKPIGAEIADSLRNFNFTAASRKTFIETDVTPIPDGRVLVVDDVETNLYVTEGLLSPYKLTVETVDSGVTALNRIKDGNVYDVVFMDHMMPVMDGIETVEKIREHGYTGIIVALTANALVGNDEFFARHGFDGFISKPIDTRQLNSMIKKIFKDKFAEDVPINNINISTNPKILKIFCRDAIKSAETLRKTSAAGDIKLFTITVHAMKSALASIGERELSSRAFDLEKAGQNGDRVFIKESAGNFIKDLEELASEMSKKLTPEAFSSDVVTEDFNYLKQQLEIIAKACADYDDTAVYSALDRIKDKKWNADTSVKLESLREMLFLHSDFEGAGEAARKMTADIN